MSHRVAPQFMVMGVTGWLQRQGSDITVQGLPVELPRGSRELMGQRVTLLGRPQTSLRGHLKTIIQVSSILPAGKSAVNGTWFRGLGKLRCADTSEQLIRLHVYRNGVAGRTFSVRLRATSGLIRGLNPAWPVAMVAGELIGSMLVVTKASPYPLQEWTSLPVPWVERWQLEGNTSGETLPLILQSASGRYFVNRRPLKRLEFEEQLREGKLWPSG